MRSNPWLAWILRATGLGLFVFLVLRSEPAAIAGVLRRADLLPLFGAGLMIFPMIAFKTARWRDLQRAVRIEGISFGDSYRAYMHGLFAGLITPGRVGEFVRVRSLTDRGAPLGSAMATVLWDRIFDVLGLLFLGSVALVPLAGSFRGLYLGSLVALGGGLLAAGIVLFGPTRRWLDRLPRPTGDPSSFLGRLLQKLSEALRALLVASRSFRGGLLLRVGILTLAGWAVYFLQAWLLATSIGLDIPFVSLVVAVTAAAVATFLPISVSGIGTRDVALVILFQGMGKTREEALAYSALVLAMLILNALVGLAVSRAPGGITQNAGDSN